MGISARVTRALSPKDPSPYDGRAYLTESLSRVKDTLSVWLDAARLLAPGQKRVRSLERHLVLMARALPPSFHGGVFRTTALLAAAANAGWEVTAVTDEAPANPPAAGIELESRIPSRVSMLRWPRPTSRPLARFSPGVDGGFTAIAAIVQNVSPLLAAHPGSILLASGPTFSEFVAANRLHRMYGTPYVLDYRDEWTECPFDFVERGLLDRFWEERCLAHASHVVFATESLRKHYLSAFPVLKRERTSTIRNGWDVTLPVAIQADSVVGNSSPATLGYFGTVASHSEFGEFATTLAAALRLDPQLRQRIRVDLYGRVSERDLDSTRQHGLEDTVHVHGLLAQPVALERMAASSALLLLNSEALHRAIPGKTFDYIGSRRPLLLYGEGGEQEALLRPLSGVAIVPRGNARELAAALRSIVSGEVESEIQRDGSDYVNSLQRSHRNDEWIALLESQLAESRIGAS